MSEEQKIISAIDECARAQAAALEILANRLSSLEGPFRRVADLLIEHNQLTLIVSEELRADRQIDHHRLADAVRTLEDSAKRIDALAKVSEKIQRLAYDTYVTVEARDSQLVEVLAKGAKATEEGTAEAKETHKRVRDMTGQFATFTQQALAKAEEKGKTPSEKLQPYWLVLKAFNELPLSTRILSTIIFGLLVAAFIAYVIEKGK